jgi:hypothetical protein
VSEGLHPRRDPNDLLAEKKTLSRRKYVPHARVLESLDVPTIDKMRTNIVNLIISIADPKET